MVRLVCAFARAGLSPWYIALLGGGGKAAPVENGNWNSIVWQFQLFQGPRPLRFGSWSVWRMHLLGRACVSWYIEIFGADAKRTRSSTETGNRLSGNFSYSMGPAPIRFGSRAVWCRHLLGRVCVSWYIALLGEEEKRHRSGRRTGDRLSGNSSYFRDPTP